VSLEDTLSLLRRVRVLTELDDAALGALGAVLTWKHVKAGETIVSHLSSEAQVYFVVEGAFRTRLETAAGRVVAIRQISAGSHFGEIAALANTPRSLAVIAETDGLIAECSQDAFLQLMNQDARFATSVASALSRIVVQLTERVFELAALEVRFRIYAELLRLAANGDTDGDGKVTIRGAPTHETIAAAVGAQREAVTRELRLLASEGVVRQDKRDIVILDLEKLRTLVRRRAGETTSDAIDWRF